jgi:hypothetical protein
LQLTSTHCPLVQMLPGGQSVQEPPHPSVWPQTFPLQLPTQLTHCAPSQTRPAGQSVQVPPQPSSWPQVLPAQLAAQQVPLMHSSPAAQEQSWPQPLA